MKMRKNFWGELRDARNAFQADKNYLENAPLSGRRKMQAKVRFEVSKTTLNYLNRELRAAKVKASKKKPGIVRGAITAQLARNRGSGHMWHPEARSSTEVPK